MLSENKVEQTASQTPVGQPEKLILPSIDPETDAALSMQLDHEILTKDEQLSCGFIIQAHHQAREAKPDAANDMELAELAQKAAQARNRLASCNLGLVASIALGFTDRVVSFMDLYQAGNVGLQEAIDRYDPAQDNTLTTFAYDWILKSVREEAASGSRTVRAQLSMAIEAVVSIDVQNAIEALPNQRMRMIIRLRWGLDDGRQHTQEELAHRFGVRRQRIGQIEGSAFELLKKDLFNYFLENHPEFVKRRKSSGDEFRFWK